MNTTRPGSQNRLFPRFVPAISVSAAILGRGTDVVQGVVSNVSESGAAVVTNRSLLGGTDVSLRLCQRQKGVLDIRAKVVWKGEGASAVRDVVGSLVGLAFVDQSSRQREEIRRFFWSSENISGDLDSKTKTVQHFDELVDPHIEEYFTGIGPSAA